MAKPNLKGVLMNNVIIVVTHKQCEIINNALYQSVIVGNQDIKMPNSWRDNIGDNISSKNPYYCELTALYWFWKNKSFQYDNIGLCHYRRYFTKNPFSNQPKYFITDKDINTYLNSYDIILPQPFYWNTTVKDIYYNLGKGKKKDLELTQNILQEIYLGFDKSFDLILNRHFSSYCNMFITSRKKFNNYCDWLFTVLQHIEKQLDMTGYNKQEKRVFGYLSELLLNAWSVHENLKIKYIPIAYTDMSSKKFFIKTLKDLYPIKKIIYGRKYG